MQKRQEKETALAIINGSLEAIIDQVEKVASLNYNFKNNTFKDEKTFNKLNKVRDLLLDSNEIIYDLLKEMEDQ